jgi:hypothetical protein
MYAQTSGTGVDPTILTRRLFRRGVNGDHDKSGRAETPLGRF